MRVIPCGGSIKENLVNNIYYAPSKRNPSEHSHIGLYNNKAVKAVGKLSNIINANLIDNDLQIKYSLKKSLNMHFKALNFSILTHY